MIVSSVSGEGMNEWLNEVLSRTDAGKRLVEVDYDVYAEGEAALGWLNTTIELSGQETDWDAFARELMQNLSVQFDTMKASVGHVKILIESGENYLIGNLTGLNDTLNFRNSAGTSAKARLTLNARVEMSPEALEAIVRKMLDATKGTQLRKKIVALRCLSPGRPNPTFRFDQVVPVF
jgi:hypothetical protein